MLHFIVKLINKTLGTQKQATEPTPVEAPQTPVPEPVTETKKESSVEDILFRLSYDSRNNPAGAVKQFQRDQGLKADGIVGPKTLARIRFYEEKLKMAPSQMKRMRRFRATHYYIAEEKDYAPVNKVPVLSKENKVLAQVPAAFFCNSALEGTGKLNDGRLMNVAGKPYVAVDSAQYKACAEVYEKHIKYMKSKGREPRPSRYFGIDYSNGKVTAVQPFWIVTPDKVGKGYGIGKKGIPHEPGKTIATDQGLYATSEPKFKGKGGLWPAGTRGWMIDIAGENSHDGWVVAADVGGGIYGAHLDFFTGTKEFYDDWPLRSNSVTYVWFDGIEDRIAPDYEYGLYDK